MRCIDLSGTAMHHRFRYLCILEAGCVVVGVGGQDFIPMCEFGASQGVWADMRGCHSADPTNYSSTILTSHRTIVPRQSSSCTYHYVIVCVKCLGHILADHKVIKQACMLARD